MSVYRMRSVGAPAGVRRNSPRRGRHPTWPRSHMTSLTGNAEAVDIDIGLFDEIGTYSTLFNGSFRSMGYRRAEADR